MNVFILAAGRGQRLRPLTDHQPKPLLDIDGRPVIDHTLERLTRWPVSKIVVNTCHLADKLAQHLATYRTPTVIISRESELLETGGGVCNALPLLGNDPFLAINGDILWDFNLDPLFLGFDSGSMDALLVLVANPPGKRGDFVIQGDTMGRLRRFQEGDAHSWTYSGVQMLNPPALASYPVAPFSLNRFYDDCMQQQRLFGIALPGAWSDIGTPATLAEARKIWKFPLHIRGN
ncbi:MAG: Nucleotidyl transferase [Magnetococcales bacterium]|nr:Nucleotidyl transferase [Magnetococcales bacterium]HIJ83308.1 nucleotidyltransferase family protein [Magnetococcales bacterium]